MKNEELQKMSLEQLLELFVTVSLAQDEAQFLFQNAKYNRLFDRMVALRIELKERPGDQRSALIPLLDHPNVQVRLNAAYSTLAVSPALAHKALGIIANENVYSQTADARGILDQLKSGTWKPMPGLD